MPSVKEEGELYNKENTTQNSKNNSRTMPGELYNKENTTQ